MTTTTVSGSGNTFSGTVQPGDEMDIEDGATSTNALIYGTEIVTGLARVDPAITPGIAHDSIVEAGGTLVDTGSATGCTVLAGGTMTVGPSAQEVGSASGDVIYGQEIVSGQYGAVGDETVHAGGTLTVQNLAVASTTTVDGGTLVVQSGAGADTILINGGTVDASGDGVAGQDPSLGGSIVFAGAGGLLEVSNATLNTSVIAGFGVGDVISVGLPGFPPTLTVSGDLVTIGTEKLDVVGASADDLALVYGGNGFLLECVCFLAGTTIATPDGGRAIETLRPGALVLTADGTARPVRWLGRQTIAARFADPLRVAPIRIRRGALGDNLPARDLLVSPDHALLVDGVLVQAGALVNFVSITREDHEMPERFRYFHIELADHSLILAEGVAAETFIDNVDRLAFDNWDEHAALDDAAAPMREMPHPRAKAHRQVPGALRQRLMARGLALAGRPAAA